MNRSSHPERGSVIVYLMIAIALLAALSFFISRNSRTNTGFISEEQARVAAQEIIDYGNTVAAAVQKLKLRGCTDTQISFESSATGTDYDNPSAPSDERCHIFSTNGGNISYANPPGGHDPLNLFGASYPSYAFFMDADIANIGTSAGNANSTELYLSLPLSNELICRQINRTLGIESESIPVDTGMGTSAGRFTGTYSHAFDFADETGGEPLIGKTAGCYDDSDQPNAYVYYQVLIAR